MEEDNTQYYNDEWNQTYKIIKDKLEELIQEELIKSHSDGKTVLPKEYNNKNNKPDGRRYKK